MSMVDETQDLPEFIPYTIPLYYTGDLDYIIAIQDLNREFSYGQVNIFSIEGE